ncbi:MAG: hypothetical protein K2Y29_19280 [Beijerinckiaceae bacterium]|nr:hypothetical protein [Beijerinckiaceae bacterium]
MNSLILVIVGLAVLASAVAGYYIAKQKQRNPTFWAAVCLFFPVFGFFIIWSLDKAEPKIPTRIMDAHRRVLSTGRAPQEATEALSASESEFSPAVLKRAADIGADAGDYFRRFFLTSHHYLSPLGVSDERISQDVDADIAKYKSRADIRSALVETGNDADRGKTERRKFFAAGDGAAILRKDGSVLVEDHGVVKCYLSLATYVDTARQWDGLVSIVDPSDIAFVRNLIFKTSSHTNVRRMTAGDFA